MKKKLSSKIKKKLSEVKAHSEFGGSQAKRISKCPASVKRCRGKQSKENDASTRGTNAHACLEYFLINRAKLKSKNLRKYVMRYAKNHPDWDRDMVDDALDTLTWVEDQISPNGELFVEEKLDTSAFTTDDQSSTLDIGIANWSARELIIADYKYGKHPVKAKWNYQLIYYALGMLIKLKAWNKIERIRLVIIQPNGPKKHSINEWTMPIDQAIRWGKRFRKTVKIALGKNPPYQHGEWCFFCLGKPGCPEFQKQMMLKEFA